MASQANCVAHSQVPAAAGRGPPDLREGCERQHPDVPSVKWKTHRRHLQPFLPWQRAAPASHAAVAVLTCSDGEVCRG
jgi:hypothetical protein